MESALRDRRPDGLGDLRVIPDEILCAILVALTPRDINYMKKQRIKAGVCQESPGKAQTVMYILCNEEPLWMHLCLKNLKHQLEYKGSWKKTTLHQYVLILSLFLHASIFVLEFVVVIFCVLSLITFEESDQFSAYPAPLLGLQTTFTK
ncbi:hypothetical protein RJ639_040852 [Escallonia herrerae]|uniref:Uncharacterized protein n=1 Tax=Escallonia herrerae TaxID=1293975 RepID=A0AA89BAH6_9ASTE|nr:hypothetical protein RJ639_040852 [Escallonia herrerae]